MVTKILKSLAIISILAMQFGCGEKRVENHLNVATLDYISNEKKMYKYELKIPQIENEKSEDISYFNVTMKEEVRYILENLSVEENDGKIKDAHISYEKHENSFGILSISTLTSVYTGGAHFINKLESYNINLKDNSILTFDKIFDEDALEYFNMKINDLIRDKERVVNTQGKEVIFFENAEADIRNANLYFEGDKIVFVFSEYDLSPYSSGMPKFTFDKKEIKKYLKL